MELQQACRGFLRQASLILDQTSSPDEASSILSLLVDVLEADEYEWAQDGAQGDAQHSNPRVGMRETHETLSGAQPHMRQTAIHLEALKTARRGSDSIWRTVCWACMDPLVEIFLTAVEAAWWPALPQELRARFFGMLQQAPAPLLLSSLSGYLGMLARATPSKGPNGSRPTLDSTAVSMLGSQTAADLLQQSFTEKACPGLYELVLYAAAMATPAAANQVPSPQQDISQQPCPDDTAHGGTHTVTPDPCQQPILLLPPGWHHQQQQVSTGGVPALFKPLVGVDSLAGLLVALPDRLAPWTAQHGAIGQETVYAGFMDQLLHMASSPHGAMQGIRQRRARQEQQQQQQQQEQQQEPQPQQQPQPSDMASVQPVPSKSIAACAAALCAHLMHRLCMRGHTQTVARVLLTHMRDASTTTSAQPPLQPATPAASSPSTFHHSTNQSVGSSNLPGTAEGEWTIEGLDSWPYFPGKLLQQAILPAVTAHLLAQPAVASKLLPALLLASSQTHPTYRTAAASITHPAHFTTPHRPPAEACMVLALLGGGHAVAEQLELRYVLTEQLLAHHTLLTPALHLLLDILDAASTDPTAAHKLAHASLPLTPEHMAWWQAVLAQEGADDVLIRPESQLSNGQVKSDAEEGERIDLGAVAAGLATVWGDVLPSGGANRGKASGDGRGRAPGVGPEAQAATARAGAGLPRQGYLSYVLVLLLGRLGKVQVERVPGLMGGLLAGVSARLASPLPAVRRQGMRVGRALSMCLDPSKPLFDDQGSLDLLPDELWPGAFPATPLPPSTGATNHTHTPPQAPPTPATRPGSRTSAAGAAGVAGSVENGVSGSDEEGVDSDDDSLEAFDLKEDLEAEAWGKIDPKSLQLRSVCAALRKSDDVTGVLGTLKRVEVLVRARPDELDMCAHDLTRALLHCRVPEWAQADEGTKPEECPPVLRGLALSAVAAVSPLPGGDALLGEVFSPHLDQHQRLLIMQTLAAAAQELSDPSRAPRLECPPGQLPRLVYPHPAPAKARATSLPGSAASAHTLTSPVGPAAGPAAGGQALAGRASEGGGPGVVVARGRTRVWGKVALDRQRRGTLPVHRNTFADVALRWTHGLLREVDRVKHGVDLLGRDTLVLCGLLHTLGVFSECATATPAALPVGLAVMELLAAPQVHGHAEAGVRRAVLLSAGQVLAALPAPCVAAAIGGVRPEDALLVKRLQWMQTWFEAASQDDSDDRCRAMAGACMQLHGALFGEAALQALQQGHSMWPELMQRRDKSKRLGGVVGSMSDMEGFQGAGSVVAGPMGLMRQGVVLLPHHSQLHA